MLGKARNHLFKRFLQIRNRSLKIGAKTIIVYPTKVRIHNNELTIGDHVYINSRPERYHAAMPFPATFLIDVPGAFIRIGNHCNLHGVYVHAQKGITIGNNCVIAAGVNILDSNGHLTHSANRTKGRDIPEEVVIGDNVWIGINAIILKGTNIGSNSVVGAGAVVRGQFPENSVIIGNPGTVVGKVDLNRK